ncbi:MAG: GWxTD domain-containing protein [Acidobacteriota bacterium]|nr:GWxTD domain-containing protein [Acidobacteriota bacterium]
MSRRLPLRFVLALAILVLGARPELFQKAKEQFRVGAYARSLETLDQLEAEGSKDVPDRERAAMTPAILFYRGANLAMLKRPAEARDAFLAYLAYQPNARLDPAIYPKPVVEALEAARRATAPGTIEPAEEGSIAAAYRAFSSVKREPPDDSSSSWAEGPARTLLTPSERRDFSGLSDPVSRSEFITAFWKARDPRPETPENEFREEFERRVAFADERFAQDEIRGSLTDRGMVFLLLGPPTYSGRKPLKTGDDVADASGLSRYNPSEVRTAAQGGGSNTDKAARVDKVTGPGATIRQGASNWVEVWHYLRASLPKEIPYPEVEFEFVTKQGYGRNVLQRDARALTALDRGRTASKPR